MNRYTIVAFFWLIIASPCLIAQDIEPESGIRAGLNISNLMIPQIEAQNARFGYHLGIFTQVPIGDNFGIKPELLFSTKGATFTNNESYTFGLPETNREIEIQLNYLDLPVMAVWGVSDFLRINAGVVASALLYSEATVADDTRLNLNYNNFNRFELMLAAGAEFDVNPISLGLRYNHGLTPVGQEGIEETYLGEVENNIIQMYATLSF